MKNHLFIFLTCSLMLPSHSHAVPYIYIKDLPRSEQRPLYALYFWTKEAIRLALLLNFFINTKTQEVSIKCSECQYQLDTHDMLTCFFLFLDQRPLDILLRLMRKGDTKKIQNFLLKAAIKKEITCPNCSKYPAWTIPATSNQILEASSK